MIKATYVVSENLYSFRNFQSEMVRPNDPHESYIDKFNTQLSKFNAKFIDKGKFRIEFDTIEDMIFFKLRFG
jgi:hypothetical protein